MKKLLSLIIYLFILFTSCSTEKDSNDYVDLGLPSGIKWATCNVGANSPSDYGDYFAWGEVEPKESYMKDSSSTYNKFHNELESLGIVDSLGILTSSYDAATHNKGEEWRMPTREEFDELMNCGIWESITLNNVNGFKVISKTNNNWIFLPAGGSKVLTTYGGTECYGYYWSSSIYDSNNNFAYSLKFRLNDIPGKFVNQDARFYGLCIRPVMK